MKVPGLPTIDHSDIDITKLGTMLDLTGNNDPAVIENEVRTLASRLKNRGRTTISNAELAAHLTRIA